MKINIFSQPRERMRYDTLGDWYYTHPPLAGGPELNIVVDSTNATEDEQFLIAVHELVECWLCQARGVTQEQVDSFDMDYGVRELEPGDHQDAPYRREHRFAMLIEHLLAHELGMDNYGRVE